ncbi:DUF4329 domain-containing protein [Thalassobius sp. I31.1]|uniref:DUF4329 domain-containing protein n=1 Tax=Thalassobius sp. I31.1 TaxID=2109912 RepID=UPI000D1A9756|nr:DUF4329 domain-containing protein [Thalassobius sp. I31.1]
MSLLNLRSLFIASFMAISAAPVAAEGYKPVGGYDKYAEEHVFAASIMEDLNAHSIFVDLEYCGFIYREQDELKATRAQKGQAASCLPILPQGNVEIFASYHTHAAFDPASYNEVPSLQDMEGDFARFENGYITTPGGRFWFVENQKRQARQLCGYRCMPFDSLYQESPDKKVPYSLTTADLEVLFNQPIE